MPRTAGIGHQDFETIRLKNNFYVDKTHFIKEWWEAEDSVTLIARPRRFGKTLNMSMLEKFFSVRYAGRGELFEGLSVWKEETYRHLQGTYPVISISFAGIKENTFPEVRKSICRVIEEQYNKNDYLLDGNWLNGKEKAFYQEVSPYMSDSTAGASLRSLCDFLSRYYGKKVILLLDEYDTPMQEAYVNGYWEELVNFIRSLFNSAFKTNPYLERAVMTGVTRISKESIFSDLNNLEVITTTSEKYADSFGFTESEVLASLEEFGLSAKIQEVKLWYDGFTFGRQTDIYNPWSIINYLNQKKPGLYWANTSSNSVVRDLVEKLDDDEGMLQEQLECLMNGGTIEKAVREDITYDTIYDNEENLWNFLFFTGYLKKASARQKGNNQYVTLAIPNREVSYIYQYTIHTWFDKKQKNFDMMPFYTALEEGDTDKLEEEISRFLEQTISYFDYGESYYHGFLAGLLQRNGKYRIFSNREAGVGRADLILKTPRIRRGRAVILELKAVKRFQDMEKGCQEALMQIEKKKYKEELQQEGYENIVGFGVCFYRKECIVRNGEGL